MAFTVLLTADAADDLRDLYRYISKHDSSKKAGYVLDQIENKFVSPGEMPERGRHPKELIYLGIRDYRGNRLSKSSNKGDLDGNRFTGEETDEADEYRKNIENSGSKSRDVREDRQQIYPFGEASKPMQGGTYMGDS